LWVMKLPARRARDGICVTPRRANGRDGADERERPRAWAAHSAAPRPHPLSLPRGRWT